MWPKQKRYSGVLGMLLPKAAIRLSPIFVSQLLAKQFVRSVQLAAKSWLKSGCREQPSNGILNRFQRLHPQNGFATFWIVAASSRD